MIHNYKMYIPVLPCRTDLVGRSRSRLQVSLAVTAADAVHGAVQNVSTTARNTQQRWGSTATCMLISTQILVTTSYNHSTILSPPLTKQRKWRQACSQALLVGIAYHLEYLSVWHIHHIWHISSDISIWYNYQAAGGYHMRVLTE